MADAESPLGERIIEAPVPVGRSSLWARSKRRYEGGALDLWQRGAVPSEISTHPLLADAVLALVEAWASDAGLSGGPLDLIELGAGSGRFSFQLVTALERRSTSETRVVMTDVSRAPLDALASHPQLRAALDAGRLALATFDVEQPSALRFLDDKAPASSPPRGRVVIANYVFDSVPCDFYSSSDAGRGIDEWQLALIADPAHGEDDGSVNAVQGRFSRAPLASLPEDPRLRDAVLSFGRLGYPLFCTSAAALACVDFFSHNKIPTLMIVSDKAFIARDQPTRLKRPFVQRHGGTISATVDLELLAHMVRADGGCALLPTTPTSFSTAAFALGQPAAPDAERAFARHFAERPLIDQLRVQLGFAATLTEESAIEDFVSVLRASGGDAEVFTRLHSALVRKLREPVDAVNRPGLIDALRVCATRLFLTHRHHHDCMLWLAERFAVLGEIGDASRCYALVHACGGPQHLALAGMAACARARGDEADALAHIEALQATPVERRERAVKKRLLASLSG